MPKQLITLEIDYPLLHDNGDGTHSIRPEPRAWSIESALDEYDDPDEPDYRTYTNGVRVVQASAVVYTESDKVEAAEAETTLLELGIHE